MLIPVVKRDNNIENIVFSKSFITMNIHIRQARPDDAPTVFALVQKAFEQEEHSDHQEQFLVEKLCLSTGFIPELSLVAELDHKLVGYILLTKIKIVNENSKTSYTSLALAPIAVSPEFQGKAIGSKLIAEAHRIAEQLQFGSIIVLGHADYYPKFGYKKMIEYGIKMPFDAPNENCMLIELRQGALAGVSGTVSYPKEFGIQ